MQKTLDEIKALLALQTGYPTDYMVKREIAISGGKILEMEHTQCGPFDINSSFAVLSMDNGEIYCQWYWTGVIPENESEIGNFKWNIPGHFETVQIVNGMPQAENYTLPETLDEHPEISLPEIVRQPLIQSGNPQLDKNFVPYAAENYKIPPVPCGYKHVTGNWDNGYTIERCSDKSSFTWIPVMAIPADGTVDGKNYNNSLGYRKYGYCGEFFGSHDAILSSQIESVEKYGGFYISSFTAEKGQNESCSFTGTGIPWTFVNLREAETLAGKFEYKTQLRSHLPYAVEMDTVFRWLIFSGLLTDKDIKRAAGIRDNRDPSRKSLCSGKKEDCRNGIFGICGCVDEWTHESVDDSYMKVCGGTCTWPTTTRCYYRPYACYNYTGFRTVLWIL